MTQNKGNADFVLEQLRDIKGRLRGMGADNITYAATLLAERLMSFLIIPILTKNQPAVVYGEWSQIVVSASLFLHVLLLGFATSMVKLISGRPRESSSAVFNAAMFAFFANMLLFSVLLLFAGDVFSLLIFGDAGYGDYLAVFGFYVFVEGLNELFLTYLRARARIARISLYYFIKNVIRVAALFLCIVVFKLSLVPAVYWLAGVTLFFLLILYSIEIFPEASFRLKGGAAGLRELLGLAPHLVLYAVVTWINSFVSRYFLLHLEGMENVSSFAVASSMAAIAAFPYITLSYTLYPRLAALHNNNDPAGLQEEFSRNMKYMLALTAPIVVILAFMSRPLVAVLATGELYASWDVYFSLNLSTLLFGIAQIMASPIIVCGSIPWLFRIGVAALIVNIILNAVLLPLFGASGAALSVLGYNLVLTVLYYMVLARHVRLRLALADMIDMAVACAALAAMSYAAAEVYRLSGIIALVYCACAFALYFIILVSFRHMRRKTQKQG